MNIKDTVSAARAQYKKHETTIKKVKTVVSGALASRTQIKDAFQAVKTKTTESVNSTAAKAAANVEGKLHLMGKVKVAGGLLGTVAGLASLPGKVATAVKDLRTAVRTGSKDDFLKAAKSGLDTAGAAVKTAAGALNSAVTVQKLHATYSAASAAFKTVAPHASPAVAKAVAKAAMKSTFEGATKQIGRAAVREAVKDAAKIGGGMTAIAGTATRAAAKAALSGGAHAAAEAATHAGLRVAAGTLGKAAARFAPGVNIALAAIDTASAAATLADPKASMGSKVTSCITAAGSIVSATNIPVVSQIGAAVSTVSSLVGAFF